MNLIQVGVFFCQTASVRMSSKAKYFLDLSQHITNYIVKDFSHNLGSTDSKATLGILS